MTLERAGRATGTGDHGSASAPATRRRGAALEDALLDAAWSVLVADGYSGFTYEAIAGRAGTGRAVLYRRWPRRRLLLEAVLRRYWTPIELPDTGELRGDALALLRVVNEKRAALINVFTVQLADYYRETRTRPEQVRDVVGLPDRAGSFGALADRAVERGELPGAPGSERLRNLPLDLLRHDMLLRSGPVPDDVLVEIVDAVWLPLLRARP